MMAVTSVGEKERAMSKTIEDEVVYFYDYHPTPEDLMGEAASHFNLIQYLLLVLEWLFHDQTCAIYHNLNFYHTSDAQEHPSAPDVALIKGVPRRKVRSLRIGKTSQAPHV